MNEPTERTLRARTIGHKNFVCYCPFYRQLNCQDSTRIRQFHSQIYRHSKTDQEGEGFVKSIPYGHEHKTCPVRAWQVWKAVAGLTDGQAFRSLTRHGKLGASLSDQAVADMIKRRAKAVRLEYADFSGHSLRAGLATAGVSERVIAKQTGHKSMPVLRGYIREGSLFTENAAAKVGL